MPLTFLGRLARDRRGNTLAIMAAALVPLAGMVGGGIDLARMYITKTRLQHACDAGALAGRKAMGGGHWSQENGKPNEIARGFFTANYKVGSFGSDDLTYTYSESAGKVTGTASASLPMTLTRVIGQDTTDIEVTCEAEMRLPNTDVMFVLDNTGSMNEYAKSGDPQRKMEALKSAVKCFYEILARLDTSELCTGDAPSGGTSSEVQIRFGFMPYDMNVNVGRLLPSNWFVDRATYQSRALTTVTGTIASFFDAAGVPDYGAWSGNKTMTNVADEAACKAANNESVQTVNGAFSTAFDKSEGIDVTATAKAADYQTGPGIQTGAGTWQASRTVKESKNRFVSYKASNKTCTYQVATRSWTRTYNFRQAADGAPDSFVFNAWRYRPVEYDIAQMKDGTGWKAGYKYPVPTLAGGTSNQTWDGCIEERATVRQDSYWPIPAAAHDLQIDELPTGSDDTRWKPALKSLNFPRKPTQDNRTASPGSWTTDEIKTFNTFSGQGYSCVVEAKLLQTWPSADDFEGYVNSMKSQGNTYHDIGLVWGARFLSPTGLFAADNATTKRGGAIQRHLIFMTDGDACTESHNYQAYGMAWYERRQTPAGDVPTDGCSANSVPGTLTNQVTARTRALCTAVKNMKDTTLWVIWFGNKQDKIEADMKACATTDRYFAARDSASLQTTFRQIANQISQLRVTN